MVVILAIVIPSMLGVILFVMSGGFPTSGPSPGVFLGSADQTEGNVTMPIYTGYFESVRPDGIHVLLHTNLTNWSAPTGLPPPDASVLVLVGTLTIRVFWLDPDDDGNLSTGDSFWITGDGVPLPHATSFTFMLREQAERESQEVSWVTPP